MNPFLAQNYKKFTRIEYKKIVNNTICLGKLNKFRIYTVRDDSHFFKGVCGCSRV